MTKRLDLEDFAAPFAAFLAASREEEPFVFRAGAVPQPPAHLESPRLVVNCGSHDYNGTFRVDHLSFFAKKETYEALGVASMCALLSAQPAVVEIALTHPCSDVKRLRLEFAHKRAAAHGLHLAPIAFVYCPARPSRRPWVGEFGADPYRDYPGFDLAAAYGPPITRDQWESRNVVKVFGQSEGVGRLIKLLFDMSRPENPENEFVLEGEGGFRGVTALSAEATFWLPGGSGWPPTGWERD